MDIGGHQLGSELTQGESPTTCLRRHVIIPALPTPFPGLPVIAMIADSGSGTADERDWQPAG